ncbi:MAG: aminotransferase class III-fold pyridoxal phosphate-dependent enzyme, partial [Hyphomicrobiaceae bacterium]
DRAILKVMRADCDTAFLDMQIAAITRLTWTGGQQNPCVPRVVATRDGHNVATLKDREDRDRLAWVLEARPGIPYARLHPQSRSLIERIGDTLGTIDQSLLDFDHPSLDRVMKWNLCDPFWARDHLGLIEDANRRAQLTGILDTFETECASGLKNLPVQAIHNDLNDYNILCRTNADGSQELTGIIDFGDMIRGPAVCDLAIAGAYVLLDQPKPVEALAALVAGYHTQRPLSEDEVALVWPLALTRLAVSALNAAHMRQKNPDDPYVMISQAPIDRFLWRLPGLNAAYIAARLRHAAGHDAMPVTAFVAKQLADLGEQAAPVFDVDLTDAQILDLSVTGADSPQNPLSGDPEELETVVAAHAPNGEPVLGRYAEPRLICTAPGFFSGDHPVSDRRTIHMAIDVFLPAETPVRAPLDGIVHSVEICPEHLGYGGVMTLRHETKEGAPFFTLYGHLAHEVTKRHAVDARIKAGDVIALLGSDGENGGWPPHLHLQLGLFDAPGSEWPGVADPDEWDVWQQLCPDPAVLLGLPAGYATAPELDAVALRAKRDAQSAANVKLSYSEPVTIVRGWKNILFDDRGRPYLDAYNNVPHVGHAHPRITDVAHRQMRLINTNTRYLQPVHEAYTEALASRLPDPLNVVFLVNSASEANELALRLARTFTSAKETIVSAAGYHGHTCAAIDISDYKFSGPGGAGKRDWVHVVPNPDTYRGPYTADDPDAGAKYAAPVAEVCTRLSREGRDLAAFISEPFPSVGGQIVPPPGYLKAVYAHVRAAGGLCIADEVQTGLGRLGAHEWGFAQQDAVPDIVVLGKPIGNGYPLAAVITTRGIADAFANGMEFFSTFGGSTLACVIGHEVLKILDDERLAENAATVGDHLLAGLRVRAKTTPAIGDVRGLGFFLGVEMIEPDGSHSPRKAAYVVNRLRERRILIGSDGPKDNVLKIRPPLCFSKDDANIFLDAIGDVFAEDVIQDA